MAENDQAPPPSDLPPQESNPVDDLFAAGSGERGDGLIIELVGGGEGPGWTGDTYLGAPIQKGIVGKFHGPLEQIQRQLEDLAGGGRYKWSGRDSSGKPRTGTFLIPGAPRFHRPNDPAAAAFGGFGMTPGFGGFGPPPPAYPGGAAPPPPPGAPAYPADPLGTIPPYSWVWSPAQNRYIWFAPDNSPPPMGCFPPRTPPGGGGYGYGGFGPSVFHQDDETPTVKALREQVTKLEAKLDAKNDGGGSKDFAALILQGMSQQQTMLMNMFAADRTATAQRAADEKAFRDSQEAQRKAIWDEQKALLKTTTTTAPSAVSPIHAAIEKAVAEKVATDLFSDGKKKTEPQDEMSPTERIGEKVVDALTNFAELGKKWLDKPEKAADKKPEKNGASNGNGSRAASSDDGLDDQARQWITLLEVAHEAYAAQREPSTARDMIFASCKTCGADFDLVAQSLKTFSAQQLLGLLSQLDERAQARAKPIADAFSTGDGRAWFDRLVGVFRGAAATQE